MRWLKKFFTDLYQVKPPGCPSCGTIHICMKYDDEPRHDVVVRIVQVDGVQQTFNNHDILIAEINISINTRSACNPYSHASNGQPYSWHTCPTEEVPD